jgi:glycine cleavage system transcriptional repressor
MEEKYLVISALGPDRPGLVSEVTHFIAERGGNVEDSRMAVLGGEFGIMALVSGTDSQIEAISNAAAQLESRTGLTCLVRPTESPEAHRKATVVPCRILANALDHEGIVRAVSTALFETGINIVSLHTTAYNAPITGSPLFQLEVTVDVPREVSVSQVRQAMSHVADAEGLDIEVRALVG